jgi:hypothetical protein
MSNPLNQYEDVRVKRAQVLSDIHEFLTEYFNGGYSSQIHLQETDIVLNNDTQISQKTSSRNPRESHWYTINIRRQETQGQIQTLDVDTTGITSETVQPTVTYSISDCQPNYGIGESGIWSTKQLLRGFDEIISALDELGMSQREINKISNTGEEMSDIIQSFEPTKSDIVELIVSGDIDAVESLTAVTNPESVDELRNNSIRSYGDDFPPIPRAFVINSSQVQTEYSDEDVALLRGTTDSYDLGLLVGIDDGVAFYHPMPRSLRLDNLNYDVDREDIRDLMAYDEEWEKGQKIQPNTWYRIQGDLLMKQVPTSDIVEKYQRIELCSTIDGDTERQFLQSTELWPLDGQIRFNTVRPNILPKITISYPSGSARRTIEDDIREIMDFDQDTDVGVRLVDMLIDWILQNYDVAQRAEQTRQESLQESPQDQFVTQLDNHLLFVEDAHFEPQPEMIYQSFMPDDREFTYFTVENIANMNIEHNEHEQTPVVLDTGTYILTLARRRNR